MSQIHFPIEIWVEIMNHQPITYVIISRLSRWHYNGVVDKLQHYKTASCVEVIEDGKKYYVLPNGNKHGKSISYVEYGKVARENNYVNCDVIWYFDYGKVACERNYTDGKLHGKTIWYYESGKVACECDFINGKRHGKSISYFESGEIRDEDNYINDELI